MQASCVDVADCLQSFHPKITQAVSKFNLRVVCRANECQEKPIHYLTSDPLERDTNCPGIHTLVVCEINEQKPRDITLEESYWYKGITLSVPASFKPTSNVLKPETVSLIIFVYGCYCDSR